MSFSARVGSRSVADARQWSSLALVLLGSASALLWAIGAGVPYGYDSSAAYLTYRAAYNALTFPGANALIADISVSPDPAAHPAFDLHTPNVFAQVLTQLLLRAGVSALPAHTALAVVVSLFGVFLAIKVLTRLGGPALAMATALLFALQYVGVLGWTTNLQAALHFPLFWGNVYLLQRYVDRPSRSRLAGVAVGIAAVFVNDLALGAFVLLTVVFLFGQLPNPSRAKLRLTLSATAGAAVGLTFLLLVAGSGVLGALLPTDVRDQWPQLPSAFRAMFALGHGALALLVYGVLLSELARAAWSAVFRGRLPVWPADLGLLVGLIGSIGAALWLDRSWSLVDDWELIPGRPVAHIALWLALVGLLFGLGLRLTRRHQFLADPFEVVPATRGALTARSFVIATGVAALVLILLPIGDFTAAYIRSYAPALVFLEDVILAAFALMLVGRMREAKRWSAQFVAIAATLLVLGSYWVLFQGKLAMRYPPREISVASALRGNAALAGAAFIAPDLPQIVWYYTRGRALPDEDPGLAQGPGFVVCARVPTASPAPQPIQCGQWTDLLDTDSSPAGPGRTLFRTPDYVIYALQSCGPPQTNTSCSTQSASPPRLEPLGSEPNAFHVQLTVTLDPLDSVAHVDYQYVQDAGTPEADSIVRLYTLQSSGNWCLIDEAAGSHDIHFSPPSGGPFRAAVIPRSTLAVGQTYFSDSVQVQMVSVVDLPNTRDGGVQEIVANSLEEAKQVALAAGTWNPAAGTLGPNSQHWRDQAPTVDQQCRR